MVLQNTKEKAGSSPKRLGEYAKKGPRRRVYLSEKAFETDYPDLLALQIESFQELFDIGDTRFQKKQKKLFQTFQEHFPISDARGNYVLEFLGFTVLPPCYTPDECLELGISYDVPLKIRLRLTCKDNEGTRVVEEDVYLLNIPYMTAKGSFIFKGIELGVISQLERSPGVFFSQTKHATGVKLYTAKIIPSIGTWNEFFIDVYNVMYAYLDRKKKVPVTLLLRAMGYGTDKEILQLFDLAEEVSVREASLKKHKGCVLAGKVLRTWNEDLVDVETDEVMTITRHELVLDRNTVIDDEVIAKILSSDERKVMVLRRDAYEHPFFFIYNTLQKDETDSRNEAVHYIYQQFRNAAPADEVTAQEFVKQLLFGSKRAFLGKIGWQSLHRKLGIKIPEDVLTLNEEAIVATIKAFADLQAGKRSTEDMDSLVHRVVSLPGDLVHAALMRGIKLATHYARESINNQSHENIRPFDIISGSHIVSALNSFFGVDPNAQYKDQTNVLSEVEHSRRLTKIGKNLSKDRAGADARDVHATYYGRICPLLTPEGPNIGLVNSFALYTRLDELGFLQAPYKRVKEGKVELDRTVYLTAEEEDGHVMAECTDSVDEQGNITAEKVLARDTKGEFRYVSPKKVDYMDVRNDVPFSVAASLIPFVANTEPGRATGGANMQRQAVPLLTQSVPIVGTGQEKRVARDARVLFTAEADGVVHYVDANKVVIQEDVPKKFQNLLLKKPFRTYPLTRLRPTNQGVAIIQRPVVEKGQKVKKGDFLCEGYTVKDGELALGQNLRVAVAAFHGYNFEDSIVLSERLLKGDGLTSIHIEDHTVDAFTTKLGPEEFTPDIPGVREQALQALDERGLVRVGTEIKEGDILVGKITPQSNETPTPEAKLIAAIFGDAASNVRDTSFRAPFGCKGTVIAADILYGQQALQRKSKDIVQKVKVLEGEVFASLADLRSATIQKLAKLLKGGEREEKVACSVSAEKLCNLLQGKRKRGDVSSSLEGYFLDMLMDVQEQVLGEKGEIGDLVTVFTEYKFVEDKEVNEGITFLYKEFKGVYDDINTKYRKEKKRIEVGHELPPGVRKRARIRIARKCKIEVGDKLSGRHGNKGVISRIVPEEDMPYQEDGTRIDIMINPLSATSRMNLGQFFELLLASAGEKLGHNYAVPVFDKTDIHAVNKELAKAGLPAYGLTKLYNGLTGEPFEQKVTCGVIYILKLVHMVSKKIHARATGPHALITQQPISGRSRTGGQKFGEMDWWACSSHGAAYTTLEMLTVKSDDVRGRRETLEALYEGKNLPKPYVPESLKFLEQILYALCINMKFIN